MHIPTACYTIKKRSNIYQKISTMKTLKKICQGLAVLAILDLMILVAGMAQIAQEGRTGHWSPFWIKQASIMVSLLQ